jgi:hypothetical protein
LGCLTPTPAPIVAAVDVAEAAEAAAEAVEGETMRVMPAGGVWSAEASESLTSLDLSPPEGVSQW